MDKSPNKRERGRPKLSDGGSIQIAIRFPAEMVKAVDDLASARMDRPDRAAMIRELLADAIEARQGKRKR